MGFRAKSGMDCLEWVIPLWTVMTISAPPVPRINFGIPYNMGGRASNGSGFSLTRRLRDREGGEWEGAGQGD